MNTPRSNDGVLPKPILRTLSNERHSSSPPDEKSKNNEPKKTLPNTRLLTNLRSFNIEKSKYKHYGHQLSMNAQSLEQIMNQTQPEKSDEKVSSPSSPNSPTDTPQIPIDDLVAQALGISRNSIATSVWPYNMETLQEIVKLKIEQEKTRQLAAKNQFASTVMEMLQVAKSMHVSGDLIPLLFLDSIEDLKARVAQLQEVSSSTSTSRTPQMEPVEARSKRKFSELLQQLPSFDETAENVRSASSRLVSPDKSPEHTHIRYPSDTTVGSTGGAGAGGPAQPQMYPVYYQAVPPPGSKPDESAGPAPPSGATAPANAATALGSPYSQKYQPVVYPPQGQGPYGGSPYGPQQHPYHYYMPSPPANAPGQQYVVGPVPVGVVPGYPGAPYPPQQDEKDRASTGHSPRELKAVPTLGGGAPATKKQKAGGKSGINFMISTPKNPPARKYNNTNKDKEVK